MNDRITRIAFWSGPRNVSTALMRAWGSRPDTVVTDEPLYAHFLARTGRQHPGRDEILASQPNGADEVVAGLLGPLPEGRRVSYQKHMARHLIDEVPRAWLDEVHHGFLLRDPGEVIASYTKVIANPSAEDLGSPQMVEIFDRERELTGVVPPVIDARVLLSDPRAALTRLCAAFGLEFDERMLSWEPGQHASDGVWAPHWYANVERTTGFEAYHPREVSIPDELRGVHAECRRHYDYLSQFAIEV